MISHGPSNERESKTLRSMGLRVWTRHYKPKQIIVAFSKYKLARRRLGPFSFLFFFTW